MPEENFDEVCPWCGNGIEDCECGFDEDDGEYWDDKDDEEPDE